MPLRLNRLALPRKREELGLTYPKIFLTEVDWYKVKVSNSIFEDMGEHAGEVGISLMKYLKTN